MSSSKEEVGSLLDALLLESLYLIEEQTRCRVNIERLTSGGKLSLAQTRYQQNSMAISIAQIPTENSAEFNALSTVYTVPDDTTLTGTMSTLQKHGVDKTEGYVEPLHWFSKLPSMSLKAAATQFKQSIEFAVENVNLQRELCAVLESIQRLKIYFANKYSSEAER